MLEKKIPGSMELNHKQHESFLQPVRATSLSLGCSFDGLQLEELIKYIETATEDKFDAAAFRSKVRHTYYTLART